MPVGWAAAAATLDAPRGLRRGCVNETLCEVAISRNLGRQPMLVVEGGREGVAASACMAVAAPGVKEGGG